MHRTTTGLGALALIAFASSPVRATLVSTFDANNNGWLLADVPPTAHISSDPATAALPWDPVNGLPAGSVRAGDVFPETFISAPPAFLGDRSALFGKTISYDIYLRFADAIPYGAIALRGASATIYWKPDAPPPTDQWSHISVALDDSAPWRVNSENAIVFATNAQIQAVLADLRGIYLRTEWRTGPDDTSIDNVVLGTPAPACIGDITGDGLTNSADFNVLASNFGNTVTPGTSGDLTGDGIVNSADFNVLAGDFGCGS